MGDAPSWLAGQPLIITGSWDTTPIFRVRRGVDSPLQASEYEQRYSAATVAAIKELGVTLAVIDFMKAFGLRAELEIAEGLRDFMAACKQNGIRLGAYVGSTIGYETLLLERPDAADWLVENPAGGYLDYQDPPDEQSFRARVYFPHRGYRAYIKQVLTAAIADFGFDEIHFDSASVMADIPIFYHPHGVEDFRKFLSDRYDPAGLKQRLGLSDVGAVLPPRGIINPLRDPLMQEWADFRCQMLADYFAEMRSHIRALNPEVAVSVNTVAGISIRNMELGGVDHARLLPHVDLLWNEEQDLASVQSGVLVSRIRSYKMVNGAGKRMLTYTGGSGQQKLQLAEAMAYNRETLGMVGDPKNAAAFPPDQRPFVDFFRQNFDCYAGVESGAEVAVLHSFHSMTYNSRGPRQSSLLFQQVLIQTKIPFDIIFDRQLADLSRYRVLALPDQECFDDEQNDAIRAFVQGGGGLVVTEFTSLYNAKRQRLQQFGLGDLLTGIPVPKISEGVDEVLDIPVARLTVGPGRVAYVPDVKAAEDIFSSRTPHYPLPSNWTDLRDAVQWAAGGPLALEVDAPLTVTTEITRSQDGARYFIHLLNYLDREPACVAGIRFRVPEGRAVASAELLSPGCPTAALSVSMDGGVALCTVASLDTYAVVRITLR